MRRRSFSKLLPKTRQETPRPPRSIYTIQLVEVSRRESGYVLGVDPEAFLKWTTIKIVILGLVAFAFGTAAGVLFGKIMCKLSGGKINPLIGSAGVSAVPMAARVSQKVGAEADPTNFLLMHAMGPNVAGVIGTAVAAGVFMAIFGV